MKKCTKCSKEHEHYHIGFADGCKYYDECFECCSYPSCVRTRQEVSK